MSLGEDKQIEFEERAGIMEFCGGLPRAEAERLAKERPWEKDKQWGMPRAEQMTLEGFDYKSAVREFLEKR